LIQPHPVAGLPVGPFLCAGAAVLGALLPDLDAGEATIHHELGAINGLIRSGLELCGIKHRGVLHSGLATLVVLGLGLLIGGRYGYADVGLALGLGYLSHVVLADALTISGVPLVWPVSARRCHLLPRRFRIRTGGPVEQLIFGLVAVILIWLLPALLPTDLVDLLDPFIVGLFL
jgi:membrane-bound metal-dependent hydrolase YbcI (DUF457 family)